MNLSRRKFFTGLGVVLAAPAIVRVASIMPVRPVFDEAAFHELIDRKMQQLADQLAREFWKGDDISIFGEILTKISAEPEPRIAICSPYFYKQLSAAVRVA